MSSQRIYSLLRRAVVLSVLPLTLAAVIPTKAQASLYSTTVRDLDNATGYWRLGESSGTTAIDSSILGNYNGIYNGGVTLGQSGAIFNDPDPAASFDGINDYVQTYLDSNLPELTIEAWFKSDVNWGERSIVDSDVSGHYGHSLIQGYWNGDSSLDVQHHDGQYDSPFNVQPGVWYHAVARFMSGNVDLHVNGTLIGSKTFVQSTPDGDNFRIGRHNVFDPQ
ncbi:MAG TPA: hypothetical protein DDZ80_22090 [Cyanobacteria bacterium UBA8803]|nr:hypothetical protein [Cyanobacteria bacterium UBA9273]HBL61022.1 hypothetical protein [Cyanobacteria bacterium UBA8803]